MRMFYALAVLASFCSIASAQEYRLDLELPASFRVGPQSGAGGVTFTFSTEFSVSMTIDIEPFQSITVTDISATMPPGVFELPEFNGNVFLTVDSFSASMNQPVTLDLNPSSGGTFTTPFITQFDGSANFIGQWDNYTFHEDIPLDTTFSRMFSGIDRFRIDPNSMTQDSVMITLGAGDAVITNDFRSPLEPNYELRNFFANFSGGTFEFLATTTSSPAAFNGIEPGSANHPAVPEPSTAILVIVAMLVCRRRI
jgi:hypothetical protein